MYEIVKPGRMAFYFKGDVNSVKNRGDEIANYVGVGPDEGFHQRLAGSILNLNKDDCSLSLHSQLVALNLAQRSGLLDQMLMQLLAMGSAPLQPTLDGSFIQRESGNNSLKRTTVRQKSHDQRDEIEGFLQAIKDSALGFSKALAALGTKEAAFFLVMYANVTLISLTSGRAIQVRVKYIFWGQQRSFFVNVHGKIVA